MYQFFEKRKIFRMIMDWIVIFTIVCTIFYIFDGTDFATAWFVPIYINIYVLSMFAYVNIVHEHPKKRMNKIQWLDIVRWINSIGFILHTTIGFYTRTYEKVVEPVWSQNINTIIITILIYISIIVISNILIYIIKHKQITNV